MNSRQENDSTGCRIGSLNLSGLTMTRVVLWLIAIAIVSFALGFSILALSGDFPPGSGQKATPFRNTVLASPNTTSFALDGATDGDIRVLLGAGDFSLRDGAAPGQLMEATVSSQRPEMQPDYATGLNGSTRQVSMTETGHKKKDWVVAHAPESWANMWDVRLAGDVPVALTLNVGAGSSVLTLGGVRLTSLTVNNGAGDTTIDLAGYRGPAFPAQIHNGVGDLVLHIDRGSNTRVFIHHGVGDVDTAGVVQNGDYYTTAGFNPALPVNEISVTQGVGSIQLEAV